MQYYTQRSTKDAGIGNVIRFETGEHPKKRENRVGTLTIQVACRTTTSLESENTDSSKAAVSQCEMVIKCCNMAPVLSGVIQKQCILVVPHKDALCKYANAYLSRQYAGSNAGGANGGTGLASLSDSLYVLGVEIVGGDAGCMTPASSIWERAKDANTNEDEGAKKGVRGACKRKFTGDGASDRGMNNTTNNSRSSTIVHIKFCRVEDVPLIMQACRVFFRQLDSAGGKLQIEFPRGEMPMWWRIQNDPPFDFKKTRDDFHNVEVVEQFRERTGCHCFTCFGVDPTDVLFSNRMRTPDGKAWIPVLYVDFLKLVLLDEWQVARLVHKTSGIQIADAAGSMRAERNF